MKRFTLLILTLLAISCSTDSIVEKNIKNYFNEEFPEYKILSAEFSRLYILHPLDDEKIPSPDTTDFAATFAHSMSMTGAGAALSLISNGCNRNAINQIVENDEIFRKWETGAVDYVKVGFLRIEDEDKDVEKIGICFKIDSLYNVANMYLVSDDRYVYSKVFDKN